MKSKVFHLNVLNSESSYSLFYFSLREVLKPVVFYLPLTFSLGSNQYPSSTTLDVDGFLLWNMLLFLQTQIIPIFPFYPFFFFLLLDYPLFLGPCLKQVSQDLPKFGNTERRQEAGEQIITVFTDKTVEKHHALVRRPNDSINVSCLHVLQ